MVVAISSAAATSISAAMPIAVIDWPRSGSEKIWSR